MDSGRIAALGRLWGSEFKTGVTVGRDVTLDELRSQGFQAFFMGIGAHLGYKLKIAGETDYPQVYRRHFVPPGTSI